MAQSLKHSNDVPPPPLLLPPYHLRVPLTFLTIFCSSIKNARMILRVRVWGGE